MHLHGEATRARRLLLRGPAGQEDEGLHDGLADLLAQYNVNDYAASVKVYAVKPKP